jgi:hypothetical protein
LGINLIRRNTTKKSRQINEKKKHLSTVIESRIFSNEVKPTVLEVVVVLWRYPL